jgi:hypothetical protein
MDFLAREGVVAIAWRHGKKGGTVKIHFWFGGLLLSIALRSVSAAPVDVSRARIQGAGPISNNDAARMCSGANHLEEQKSTKSGHFTFTTTSTVVIEYLSWFPAVSSESIPPGFRLPCKNCKVYPIKIGGYFRSDVNSGGTVNTKAYSKTSKVNFRRVGYVGKESSFNEWICSSKAEGNA